jgi:F-type H+-transporting ATPase subunit epsilon
MRLSVLLPTEALVDRDDVVSISVDATDGRRTLKPRHIDAVIPLDPGIVSYTADGREHLVAVDRGVLVKVGARVLVSVHDGVTGDSLDTLETTVEERLAARSQQEQRALDAAARLEAGFVRRFLDLR